MGCSAQPLYLGAVRFSAQHPRAKVLAIVTQDTIVALAQPRERARQYFARREAGCVDSNPYRMTVGEFCERNDFHRSAPESKRKTGVVNDKAIAGINAVMGVERARCGEMGRERRFVTGPETRVGSGGSQLEMLSEACMLGSPEHCKRR